MKKLMKPEILVPLLIVAGVLALLVFGGMTGGETAGHTHGSSTHTH
tara:strand:+ start:1765 stop:1902 length:138 start_codon:yes stop_codon:yes gene_type:complete